MKPTGNATLTAEARARIDLFRVVIGQGADNQPLAVAGVYVHRLPSYLPVSVIQATVKNEFDPADVRFLLSRPLAAEMDTVDAWFLKQAAGAGLTPLRSAVYEAPPKRVKWHFFAATATDPLAVAIRGMVAPGP
jgi:hypothetical protein